MAKSKVTLQQIADELGTSKVTVSRALNNRPGISDDLRRKILEKAKAYGHSISMQNETVHALAFLIPQRFFLENDHFYTLIYFHLNQLCQAQNIVLSAIVISRKEEQEGTMPAQFVHQKYDGIFMAGYCGDTFLDALLDVYKKPVVFIDFKKAGLESSCVVSDNYALGFEVAEYLIQQGHKQIGFVGDYRNNPNFCDRYLGLRKALLLHDLPCNPHYDLINSDFRTGLYMLPSQMPAQLPTAYICSCDMAAYYLYEKMKLMHLRVPDDISVISFDNTDICENMEPPLTSMEINKQDFARLAFEQMLMEIATPLSSMKRQFVRTHLVVRESVQRIQPD